MEVAEAVDRVLLGESLLQIRSAWRAEALDSMGMRPDEARPDTFLKEATRFAAKVCRVLGDRHAGDSRAATALADFVRRVDDYDAYDSLLANFRSFDGRELIVRRGRTLYPGTLTEHWDEEPW